MSDSRTVCRYPRAADAAGNTGSMLLWLIVATMTCGRCWLLALSSTVGMIACSAAGLSMR